MTPGSRASFRRKRAMTWSALSLRSPSGLSVTNIRPVFDVLPPLPPVKAIEVATAGSCITVLGQLQHSAPHRLERCVLVGLRWIR